MYEENVGRYAWAARRERCDLPGVAPGIDPGPTKAIRGWHGKDWTYNRAFVELQLGSATAMSLILVVFTALVTVVQFVLLKGNDE